MASVEKKLKKITNGNTASDKESIVELFKEMFKEGF